MKRFLATGLFAFTLISISHCQVINLNLKSHMEGETTLHDGRKIPIWGFISWDSLNVNKLPSPTLYFTEGDSVNLLVDNVSEMAHTIHLHGLDVNQENDGVPSTSFEIDAYKVGQYHFKVDKPGTYLYHCHVETVIHLQMGMFGALVVRPKDNPKSIYDASTTFDKEYLWLASEIDASWHDAVPLNGTVPAYEPDYFMINGKSTTQIIEDSTIAITGKPSEKIALRIANMGYGINVYQFPESINIAVVGSDGRKFDTPEYTKSLTVYPGERYGLLLNADEELNDNISITYLSNYQNLEWGVNTIPITITEHTLSQINSSGKRDTKPYDIRKTYNGYKVTSEKSIQVRLVDINGKVIENHNLSSSELIIQLPARGIYFAHIVSEGKHFVEKLYY